MKKQTYTSAADASWLQKRWIRILLWCCVAAVAVMIFTFSAQQGEASSRLSDWLAGLIIRAVDADYEPAAAAEPDVLDFVRRLVRKGAHFAEFALLGFFLRMLAGAYAIRRPTRWCFLAGALYACTDEVHQLFVAQRAGMWQDVLLDASGVLAGITFAYALLVTVRRIREKLGLAAGEPADAA